MLMTMISLYQSIGCCIIYQSFWTRQWPSHTDGCMLPMPDVSSQQVFWCNLNPNLPFVVHPSIQVEVWENKPVAEIFVGIYIDSILWEFYFFKAICVLFHPSGI
jgi:hypothetical protein